MSTASFEQLSSVNFATLHHHSKRFANLVQFAIARFLLRQLWQIGHELLPISLDVGLNDCPLLLRFDLNLGPQPLGFVDDFARLASLQLAFLFPRRGYGGSATKEVGEGGAGSVVGGEAFAEATEEEEEGNIERAMPMH
jgi:hypothetical protein